MNHDLATFEGGASGMDELAALETNDAALRHSEGPVPPGYTQHMQAMGQLETPWYKNTTFLTVVGAGAVALLLVCAMSKRRD